MGLSPLGHTLGLGRSALHPVALALQGAALLHRCSDVALDTVKLFTQLGQLPVQELATPGMARDPPVESRNLRIQVAGALLGVGELPPRPVTIALTFPVGLPVGHGWR